MRPGACLLLALAAVAPYDRGDWGGWIDADHDCQSTRTEILIRDSIIDPVLSADGCEVEWVEILCPYTGEVLKDPAEIEIDHRVALREAAAGRSTWSAEERRAFANDTSNLVAVSASENSRKGSRPPPEWMPPNHGHHCAYLARRVETQTAWALRPSWREAEYVLGTLAACRVAGETR